MRWNRELVLAVVSSTAIVGASCSSDSIDPAPPLATSLEIVSGNRQTGEPGGELGGPLVVRVLDQYGNPAAGAPVRFEVHAGGGSVAPNLATTNAEGEASARWILGADLASMQTLDAWVPLTPQPIGRFVATPVLTAGTLTLTSGADQASMVGTVVLGGPGVTVRTVRNQPVAGVVVNWEVIDGGGAVSSATSVTGSDGGAYAQWTLGPTAGTLNQRLRASVAGIGAAPVDFRATAVDRPTELNMVSGDAQVGFAGGRWAAPMVVRVRNAAYEPVPGATVHWVIVSGGGTLLDIMGGMDASDRTDAAGEAWARGTAGSLAGSVQTVAATVDGVPGVSITFALSVVAGSPRTIARHAGNGQSATVGHSLPQPIGAIVRDWYGNPVPGARVTWSTLTGGSFSSASSTTDAGGVAWTDWTLSPTVGAQTATAAADVGGPDGPAMTEFTAQAMP